MYTTYAHMIYKQAMLQQLFPHRWIQGSQQSISSCERMCTDKPAVNMNLMSNTAASYPVGAGRFEPWLFVPVAVDKEPRLETSCTHWIRSCSIAHQIHVVSTNAAMSLYGIKPAVIHLSTFQCCTDLPFQCVGRDKAPQAWGRP